MFAAFSTNDDPALFGATPQTGVGFYKLSCDQMFVRTPCVDVVHAGAILPEVDLGRDARNIRNVIVRFTYDGSEQLLHHRAG